ncbi:hypothetical protein VD0002_g9389 [Verticillium dahliae]|uniref:Nuclear pore complex protein An-Nup82 n=2 Tax=Verticillium dahliae TaxID=27337 RepID=G2X6U3_VERDV|nr:uncharacterized protein VDAG_05875 [Verticillium dahliae VdLs.17]KAF3345881.1 putative RNA-binding protein C22E12.02 [Verticillium dahliae VDG2]KAH6708229.1 hypothetical protein EV126DRAFT_331519 [Verticillium dahliae]EGY14711.1 hypothetical protein VDAG_05875 [Verticillium dahliae VdLs.17]PNH35003.1 hypothetical protein BJF96_g1694 [Verticillium dahliae]PNH42804.1 hypothetical protein VD0003_g9733 [Verticillium dahliae]
MPKIKSYTAPWLSQGPGQRLFAPSADAASPYNSKKQNIPGSKRTIARRGTEVFVAVGKELRWGDLAYLKEKWTAKHPGGRSASKIKREDSDDLQASIEEAAAAEGFRTIKTPVAMDIRQLIISPDSNHLAVLTSHTIHVCALPDPSHLTSDDTGPLKTNFRMVGPTTHVSTAAPLASALWHPLGVKSSCVVTVTTDATVRLWELSVENRWSTDKPTVSIDLKKLADGQTLDQDFTASTSAGTAFSPDSYEMEVASACFAGRGSGGWSPMTLWVAMTEGDVYALCPLLPERWAPPPTLIPSLSVSIVAKVAAIEDDPDVTEHARLLAQQQLEWMGEIDSQEPRIIEAGIAEPSVEIYNRPSKPGAVPRLQGPFDLLADPEGDDLDGLLTDIHVIGKKIDTEELMMGEDELLDMDEGEQEGLSLSIVCLLSSSGQVRVLLDLEGVEAQWLPPKGKKSRISRLAQLADPPSLLTFQSIDTMRPTEVAEDSWPMFSTDVTSRYSFFISHHAGLTYISLSPWVFRLEGELQGDVEAGADFRLGLLVNGQNSTRERLYTQPSADVLVPLAAAVAIRDLDLGYFLLSGTAFEPIALTFETPEEDFSPVRQETPLHEEKMADMQPLDFYEPRPAFQPSHAFGQQSGLPELLSMLRSSRHRTILNQEVRLSPVTLQILTDAHRVLGDDTHKLAVAVAELFRRCSTLQQELKDQIYKANEVKDKIDRISGNDKEGEGKGESDETRFERRIARAQDRQRELGERLERIRKHAGKVATRELSTKERALVEEVKSLEANLLGSTSRDAPAAKTQSQMSKRVQAVQQLREELAGEVARIQKESEVAEGANDKEGKELSASQSGDLRIPSEVRKAKLRQVRGLLDRETALVEAVTARLTALQM